ncbi:Rv1355c family protein [Mycobacterium simiae]|uniref:Rv1355c family protein n=1 Tax=Mycobacterium simiae TaxID=1784 RepID=A0A5B1BU85_MYCSI|nr:Rv1355c family protein [Mycobacterium simiae]KAA1251020.1 Rv1355c family protein [Mycobacterium simiae]
MTCGVGDAEIQILDPDDPDDYRRLENLRADACIEFLDQLDGQVESVRSLRPGPNAELIAERSRWVYYPWRRNVVAVLGPQAFRAVRLDRNRHLITVEEQGRLAALRIGVVGLSVGHVIAYTIAAEGLCGELRLADFDRLDLSNLNRVPASVLDLGTNKATAAGRRIAELDPYLRVRTFTAGVTPDALDAFLDGLDIVVEECDSLDTKILVRQAARSRQIPVVMATDHRGLVDVERFDQEPTRPILHGLLGDVDGATLAGLSAREKMPHLYRLADPGRGTAREAATLIEVGTTLSAWPQLASQVTLGAATVAEAVRRIGLGEPLLSGRTRIDIAAALDHLDEPATAHHEGTARWDGDPQSDPDAEILADVGKLPNIIDVVATAASRAPSVGNAQPWRIEVDHDAVAIELVPERTSLVDIDFRASAVAIGAAVFNARVAAAAHGVLGPVEIGHSSEQSPLCVVVKLGADSDPELARLYRPMLLRQTNRHHGTPAPIADATLELLESAARREGARLQLLRTRDEIERAAMILGESDRIRYLTPELHAELVAELRWPTDPSLESGIDVRGLELDPFRLAMLDTLCRPEVMAELARWNGGVALGAESYFRVCASSAIALVFIQGETLADYACGGSAAEAVWIRAQQHGLAAGPISPLFLYAKTSQERSDLSPNFAPQLQRLQREFNELAGTQAGESPIMVLRFCAAPSPSIRSRRRPFMRQSIQGQDGART